MSILCWPLVTRCLWYSATCSTVLWAERSGRKRGLDAVLDGLLGLSGACHGNETVSGKHPRVKGAQQEELGKGG